MSEFVTKVVIQGQDASKPAIVSATKGIQNYAKAATAAQNQVRTGTRQSRAAFTQLSYQVQDISVQLQAGQSPFIVLAQQGSQVASIFGPGGAVIGALLAVGGAIAGNLLPSLFESTSAFEDLKNMAKEAGKELEDFAPYAFTRAEYAKGVAIRDTSLALTQQVDKLAALKVEFDELVGGRKAPSFSEINDLAEETQEATLQLEKLALQFEDLTKTPQLEVKFNPFMRAYEEYIKQQEEIIKLQQQAETPLQTLQRKTQELSETVNRLGLSQKVHLALQKQLGDAYEATLPKKEKEVDVTDKQAEAYERLKQSLDPAYGAYQNYYAQVALINSQASTNEEKITMVAVAYAKLYEALGLVNEKQEKSFKTVDLAKSGLQDYHDSVKSVDDALNQLAVGAMNNMETQFSDLIKGAASVKDAFGNMALSIIDDLIRIQIQQSITKPLSGLLSGMAYESSNDFVGPPTPGGGGVFSSIKGFLGFEGGGYTGSGPRSGGLDGKGGFMAMVHPNETVIDHEKGGSGGGVTIVQNINVTTGVQQTVRAEIMGLMPQIANASKAAVLDAKRRGGSYAGAF